MKRAHCGWIVFLAAAVGLAMGVAPPAAAAWASALAQASSAQSGSNQGDALAAAARRAREKQKDQTKPAKVWDNDNIPTSNHVNVIGPSGSAAAENAAPAEATPAEPEKKAGKADLEAQLKSAQQNLQNLKTQLDFAQRKLALDQQDFYQNPDYSSDAAGAQALKNEQSQIDSQKQQVDEAQKTVDDLAAKVQAAGGNAGSSSDQKSSSEQNSNGGDNSDGSQASGSGSPQ